MIAPLVLLERRRYTPRGVPQGLSLADPELSVQSIPITNSVMGSKKTAAHVELVTIFTLAGLIFGWLVR